MNTINYNFSMSQPDPDRILPPDVLERTITTERFFIIEVGDPCAPVTLRVKIITQETLRQHGLQWAREHIGRFDSSEGKLSLHVSHDMLKKAKISSKNALVNIVDDTTGQTSQVQVGALTKDDVKHIEALIQRILLSMGLTKQAPKATAKQPQAQEKTGTKTAAHSTPLPRVSITRQDKDAGKAVKEAQRVAAQQEHQREFHKQQDKVEKRREKREEEATRLERENVKQDVNKNKIKKQETDRTKKA